MTVPKTLWSWQKTYVLVMLACFLFSGYSLFLFADHVSRSVWRSDFRPTMFVRDLNSDANRLIQIGISAGFRPPRDLDVEIFSPSPLFQLIGGIVAFAAGLTIWKITREKEIKKIREETTDNLLLPDERSVIQTLKQSGFESTQSRLAKDTGLSKVQIHRTVNKLAAKGVLEKHKYGLTNKIILKKEVFE